MWHVRPKRAARGLRPVLVAVGVASLGLLGCGLGAGRAPSAVKILITREFGGHVLRQFDRPAVKGEETVMSLLMRNDAAVTTRFGGGFVQSIDGVAGGQEAGQPVDWFYYVNGIQAGKGAATTKVHPGDRIWWDHHDWSQTQDVPAVVGSFPEPFLNGVDGKRLPVRVECAEVAGYACRTVAARFRELGVPAGISGIGSSGEPQTLHVLVGRWLGVRVAEGGLRPAERPLLRRREHADGAQREGTPGAPAALGRGPDRRDPPRRGRARLGGHRHRRGRGRPGGAGIRSLRPPRPLRGGPDRGRRATGSRRRNVSA